MSEIKARNHFTAEQKVHALKRHLLDQVPISQVCRELGCSVPTFYLWQKELFENGHLAFGQSRKAAARVEDTQQQKIVALENKLQRKDGVIAELMEEHVQLKKSLGEC